LLVSVGLYTALDVFLITWSSNYRGNDSNPFLQDLMTGLGIIWFVQIAHILSLSKFNKVLQRVGAHTMPIYLIHIPLIMIMYQLCRLVLGHLDVSIASKYASWLFGLLSVYVSMLLFKPLKRIPGLFAPPRWLIKLTSRERQHTLRARSATTSP
jgi:peptidoglycan/LPS O-acetylase OafA/YrhL